ncbi:IS110 family transposase [Microscilla marina]|uniref:ISPpu9, transposase n=1 Tax=Microscilla marina ATCC 23134 TaxID=313606 RepID=A2A0D5_MICM2|nr:transposase [Microscilla marina]EAY23910.1 ISPpu9, transposase [Microscilla marina ATCC 23134]
MKKSETKIKSSKASKKVNLSDELTKVRLKVAGVDIANNIHYTAVSPHLTKDNIRNFGAFTADLHRMADWFSELGIESVAMEATGIYWQSLYEILEDRGFDVVLVNARYPKNVSGRKSDVSDCSWIHTLHSYGLLPASFIPTQDVREFRTYVRQRQQLTKQKVQHMQHVGKALQLMNVKIQNVISDIEGKLGMKVIRAMQQESTPV